FLSMCKYLININLIMCFR
uniref:Uncharacterized protein n=1 Tax=Strigamia maritima TaxID=126957 RepID=T1JL23_STRMM